MENVANRVRAIVPPPHRPIAAGSPAQFEAFEEALGLSLPADYEELIATYGAGTWQEFWSFLNPFSANPYLNLQSQAPRDDSSGGSALSAERYLRDRDPDYPHAIWPDAGGIFPWAITDNGGRFFWLTRGEPDQWPTIYYPSRDPGYRLIDLSTSRIVYGLLSGELPLFRDEFGDDTPEPIFETAEPTNQ